MQYITRKGGLGMRKKADVLFVILLLAVLFAGLAQTVFFPKQINTYENRKANRLSSPSADSFLSGRFQDDSEAAFSDQLPASQYMKKACNYLTGSVRLTLLRLAMQDDPTHYYVFDAGQQSSTDVRFFGGRLCYAPKSLSAQRDALAARASALNEVFENHNEISFYAFFVENDGVFDFEKEESIGAFGLLLSELSLPKEQKGFFGVDSFAHFSECFYETDHHWNHRGSYAAYLELSKLLGIAEPISPTQEVALQERLCGSKAKAIGVQELLSEPFYAYRFPLAQMEITIDNTTAQYGNEDAFFASSTTAELTYGNFYGPDAGEVVFDTGREDLDNILILGDSYDNAILKLLSSHYHRTYSVDLRYYAHQTGTEFDLTSYLSSHEIDKVLFIGSLAFWTSDDFALEG